MSEEYSISRFEDMQALIAERDAEIERVTANCNALDDQNDQLRAELAALKAQEPVKYEFQGRDGKWCQFQDQRHYDNTIEDGSWPIRALYAAPVVSAEQQGVPSIESSYAMGAKGGSVVDSERLAFESWMACHCWALCAVWDGSAYKCESEHGGHFNAAAGMTRRIWAAWRDRAALAAAPAPSTTEGHGDE